MKSSIISLWLFLALVIFAGLTCVQANPTALDKALLEACKEGNPEKVEDLISQGANVDSHHGEYGITPLMWASANGHYEIVEALICNGAYVNAQADKIGTALHVAKNPKIMELLLCNGADIEAKDNFNEFTPLFRAVETCDLETVKYLVSRGADVNATAYKGLTPLGMACGRMLVPCGRKTKPNPKCKNGNLEVIKFMVQSGADTTRVVTRTFREIGAIMKPKNEAFNKCWSNYFEQVLAILKGYSGKAQVIPREQWNCPKLNCKKECKMVLQLPDPDIVPASDKYSSRISFTIECTGPPNSDGPKAEHKVKVKRKLPEGQLVMTEDGYNSDKDLELNVKEDEKTHVFYKWVGPIGDNQLEAAKDETITISTRIDDKDILEQVKLSVGIDLAIDAIEPVRKGEGETCPFREEDFRVFVKDAFHPDESVAKMAERFKTKPRLYVDRKGEVEDPFDFDDLQYGLFGPLAQEVLKSLYKGQFLASNRVVQDCKCNGCEWVIKEYQGRSQLVCQSPEGLKRLSLVMCQKGTHKFHSRIKADIDSKKDQPPGHPFEATIDEYPYRTFAWFFHSVIPAFDVLGDMLPKGAAVKAVQCCKDWWYLSESQFSSQSEALIGVTAATFSCLKSVALDDEVVKILGFKGIAAFLKKYFIVTGLVTGAMDEYWTPCTQMDYERISCSEEKSMRGTGGDDLKISQKQMTLDLTQAIVKESSANHMVLMKKDGLTDYRLEKPGKQKSIKSLKSQADALEYARSGATKIYEGKRSLNIPVFSDERQVLHLKGDGSPGSLIIVTKDNIKEYEYPDKEWQSIIEINAGGKVGFIQGDKLVAVK